MTRLVLLLLATFAITASVSGQNPRSVEDEIRRLDIAAAKAILEKDEKAISRFFAPDSVTNNPRNTLTIGSVGVIEAARSNVIDYHSFVREIESLKVRGSTAIVVGNETVVMRNRSGDAGETIRRRYTNIWMKLRGTWQIVGRHANVICP